MRAVGLILLLAATAPAVADDRTECVQGIAMIRAEIAKNPAGATLTKLRAALRVAEREQREQEFDECVDAIKDARRALGR